MVTSLQSNWALLANTGHYGSLNATEDDRMENSSMQHQPKHGATLAPYKLQ